MNFEKLDMKTINFTDENIKKLAEIFPNVVSEDENGKVIDFEALKQELSENIVDGNKERYSLNWPGKREAQLKANTPTTKTLRPCIEDSVNFDTTENLYIEGDNLEVLKILQEGYLNKIKMIYIDPPYNTGNDFIYNDNFTRDSEEELLESGQINEEGGKLVANPETNGRYHSDWLSMMYPRLKLARNLLKEDGVIFISIDDNEVHNLRKICDEIFGEDNFVSEFIWEKKKKPSFLHRNVGKLTEYIICYIKNTEKTFPFSVEKTTEGKKYPLNNAGNTINKLVFPAKSVKFNMNDTVIQPQDMSEGNIITKLLTELIIKDKYNQNEFILEGEWRYSQAKVDEIIKNKETIVISKIPFRPNHIKSGGEVKKMKNNFSPVHYEMETNEDATEQLISLFKKDLFDNPKPLKLLKTLIQAISYREEDADDIILDFFSGSGTTAHATIKLNSEDGGNRKFIMVQLPEIIDSKNNKIAYEFVKNELKKDSVVISEIGKERIRRAGKKIVEESGRTDLDIGFRVLKLDSSNMKDIYFTPQELGQSQMDYSVDNIKEDRSDLDLLFGVLIDWGVDLTLPIKKEVIQGKDCYFVDSDSLCAYFGNDINEEFIKELAKKEALRFVFKDSSFGNNDDLKDNVSQIFKQLNPQAEIKVI